MSINEVELPLEAAQLQQMLAYRRPLAPIDLTCVVSREIRRTLPTHKVDNVHTPLIKGREECQRTKKGSDFE